MGVIASIDRWFNGLFDTVEVEPSRSNLLDLNPLDWVQYQFGGNQYTLPVQTTYGSTPSESIGQGFDAFVQGAYARNGVVFACFAARSLLFSEARFQFRQMTDGRPGDLFGTSDLEILESPWPNGTTGELLVRMEQDAGLAGNFFGVRERSAFLNRDRITRLHPAKTRIALGSDKYNAEPVGYAYYENEGADPVLFPAGEVAHWSPIPDPTAQYRGMSWLTPVVRNISAHNAATGHKTKFFENGATPNMVVSMPKEVGKEEFERFVELFREHNEGVANAYKTLFLGAGADATVVGSNFEQMSFKVTQGADETIIAAAGRVPAVLLGISEGLAGSSLNAGNYGMARRQFADGWARPSWRSASAALAAIVDVPPGADLWYDDRDIAFLREDAKDDADIKQKQASTIRQLVDAGYEPATVVDAVISGDFRRLKHTNLFSVQLQPPGTTNGADPQSAAPAA